MRITKPAVLALAALAAVTVSACGTQTGTSEATSQAANQDTSAGAETTTSDEPAPADVPEVLPRTILDVWSGISVDFEPVPTDTLTENAQVVLTGTVQEVVSGRLAGESLGDPFAAPSIAVGVVVDDVEKGTAVASGDTVWIEIPIGSSDVAEAKANLPVGMPVAAFVEEAWASTPDDPKLEETAGYPDGVQLWSPVGPQGVAFGFSDIGVITPLIRDVDRAETVDDVVTE